MKGKDLDKATIDTYHAWVQYGIRNNLNSVSLGPGKLPFRAAIFLIVFGLCCLLTGILIVALRMRHVYLWDWNAQFLGPFFVILFLLCFAGASYLFIVAKRRSNKYRSQLYFKPLGDWGVSCIHASELAREEELKHELKSGTNPHKTVKPRAEAYSQSSKTARIHQGPRGDGRDNQGYDKTPMDNKPFRPDDQRRGPPPNGRRGPPPDGRRGPPPDGRRGPPPDGRRGPPPDGRRGPPPDGRRGPPPDGRRGPPPDGRRGPPPEGRRGPPPDGRRGPPPEGRRSPPPESRRGPPPEGRRSPPPEGRRGPPPDGRFRDPPPGYYESDTSQGDGPERNRGPPPSGQRPRGAPRFGAVEMIPERDRQNAQLIFDRSHEESDI
ncbi:hypothetical protein EGW08_002814 [Elysia chlorotica]|uniref:Uncharacterized protein n=1 Tax=Elysia chlorotica TaxID=188477 RepID=A0A3S0ZYS6_ELYCH|nr:hypothetical protein EGW08_002814 [Elysia chlorotica]